jgi:hypothetical protein
MAHDTGACRVSLVQLEILLAVKAVEVHSDLLSGERPIAVPSFSGGDDLLVADYVNVYGFLGWGVSNRVCVGSITKIPKGLGVEPEVERGLRDLLSLLALLLLVELALQTSLFSLSDGERGDSENALQRRGGEIRDVFSFIDGSHRAAHPE